MTNNPTSYRTMNKITATKVVRVYADVVCNGKEFRVYPDGAVFVLWHEDGDYAAWLPYDDYEDDYQDVRYYGLQAIDA